MSRDEIKNITQWMDGQTIFITGSSGFVGKVLVYKLLKSCTSVKAIYLLLRPKKGKTSAERLEQLFSSSVSKYRIRFKICNKAILMSMEFFVVRCSII